MVEFAPKFIPGVILTLQLAFFSIILGMIIGLVVAVLKLTKYKWLKKTMDVYITIVRGTPFITAIVLYFLWTPQPGYHDKQLSLGSDCFGPA